MSEIAIGSQAQSEKAINMLTALLIVAIGTLAFIAMLVLGAYAPDMRSGKNGGAHALSNAAIGFSGLVRLAADTGRNPVIVRSQDQLTDEDLTVITPEHGWTDLSTILAQRGSRATLLILPKWEASPDPQNTGWVRVAGLLPDADPERTLYPSEPLVISRRATNRQPLVTVADGAPPELRFIAPRVLQTMSGKDIRPLITDSSGAIVLGQLGGAKPFYILADPDLLNNHGMADVQQASGALAMLDYLNTSDASSVLFDVTLNGFGRSRSPLKLAFDPPFLAATLTMFAAMLLAGWQAAIRFGSPRLQERALAFGKAALVDNNAALIRKAGREARLGPRYVDVIRKRAVALFRLPASRGPEEVDSRLESLNPRWSFTSAANAVANARTRDELLGAAQSLNRWLEEAQE